MQTRITRRCVVEEEIEELGENLSAALQAEINPLDNQLGYMGKQKTLQA